MKTPLLTFGAVLVSLLILPFVLAEEDAKPTPAENFRRLTATFPAPGKEEAFSIEGYFFLRGENLGIVRLGAEPVEKEGRSFFQVEDRLELNVKGLEVVLTNRALLDSRLSGVSGEQVREQPQGTTRAAWTKDGGVLTIGMTVPQHELPDTVMEVDGEILTSISAVLLFCRQATNVGEEYALTILDANPGRTEKHLEVMTMRVQGPGPWQDGKAFLYSGNKGSQTMTIALEEGTRALLGIRIAEANGMVAEVRMNTQDPGPSAEPPPPPPVVPHDLVVETLTNPAATGMAVTMVVDGAQAKELGVLPGDVLVSYDGKETPSLEALRQAMGEVGEKASVVLTFVRGPKVLAINFKPGPMGVNLAAVVKGESAKPLPPATKVAFDFTPLREGPHDTWHSFLLGEGNKVGFEHGVIRMEDGRLLVRREVAFDGGEQWGINHFDVTIEATAEREPLFLRSRFENPVTGWVGTGEMDAAGGGKYALEFHWEFQGDSGDRDTPVAKNTIPEYLVEVLALYMPRAKGACWHFRPLSEGFGDLGLPAALLCAGPVDLTHDGETVKAWLYEQHRLGGSVPGRYWVGEDGRMLFVDYGGAQGRLSTKEEALKGLAESIVPRTAD